MGLSIEQKLEQAESRIAELTQSLTENENSAKALVDAQAQVEALTSELATERDVLTQTRKDLDTARQSVQSLTAQIEKLEAEQKTAEARAAEICASVGVSPAKVTPKGDPKAKDDLLTQFRAIADPGKQMAFYRKHREELNALMGK